MAGRVAPTRHWFDEIRGLPIDADELQRLRRRAHDLYLRNGHIFEDEADALAALGAVPCSPRSAGPDQVPDVASSASARPCLNSFCA